MATHGMDPEHPEEVLKGLYLDPMETTITQAAEDLGVSRRTLPYIVDACKRAFGYKCGNGSAFKQGTWHDCRALAEYATKL